MGSLGSTGPTHPPTHPLTLEKIFLRGKWKKRGWNSEADFRYMNFFREGGGGLRPPPPTRMVTCGLCSADDTVSTTSSTCKPPETERSLRKAERRP